MSRKKLSKFLAIRKMLNVIESHKSIYNNIKGKWHEFFGNNNPIILELGCGYGDYTIGLANKFTDKNYIGIDIKGERLWAGADLALKNKLSNVVFLQSEIYNLQYFFRAGEVSEIWITFPDPQKEKPTKRLTTSIYLNIYKQVLKSNGAIHLKTDSDLIFDYTLDVLDNFNIKDLIFTKNLYNSEFKALHQGIKTGFEKVYLEQGKTIKYLSFRFN